MKEELRSTKMSRLDTLAYNLTKITQRHDKLAVVGGTLGDLELVRIALKGFTKPWSPFVKGIIAQESIPNRRSCGMTSSKRRFKKNFYMEANKRVMIRRTFLLLVMQRGARKYR